MSPQKLLGLLSRVATVVFGLLVFYSVCWVVVSLIGIYYGGFNYPVQWKPFYNLQHVGLPVKGTSLGEMYSSDSLIKYTVNMNSYNFVFKPRSTIGYSVFLSVLTSLGIILLIVSILARVFKQLNAGNPFNRQLIKQLKQLARLFLILGAFDLINYFMLYALLAHSFSLVSRHFDFVDLVMNNFVIGIVIWIIATIFQRGIELQEENSLTI